MQVKVIRIIGNNVALVEAQDIRTGDTVAQVVRSDTNSADPSIAREHLLQGIEEIKALGHEVIMPDRYRIPGVSSAEASDLMDFFYEYCAVEFVEVLPEPRSGDGGGRPIASIEVALASKTTTTGSVAERKGKKTKTQIAREIIEANINSKTPEEMVKMIMEACDFKVGLARVYFRDNVKKVMATA